MQPSHVPDLAHQQYVMDSLIDEQKKLMNEQRTKDFLPYRYRCCSEPSLSVKAIQSLPAFVECPYRSKPKETQHTRTKPTTADPEMIKQNCELHPQRATLVCPQEGYPPPQMQFSC